MAYQENTTVNSHKHVIDLLETFLIAQGWTVDATVTAAERELYVSQANGGETFHFAIKSTGASSLQINGDTAYPSASASQVTYMNLKSSAMLRCWFFVGDLWVWIVVEVASGYFQVGGFGRLSPYDSFTPASLEGAFVVGNNNTAWSTLSAFPFYDYFSLARITQGTWYRHVPVAGVAWAAARAPVYGYETGSTANLLRTSWPLSAYRNANGLRPMLPIEISMPNNPAVTAGYQNYYPLGYLPGVRVMNGFGVANASEQTLGSDVWKRFSPPHNNFAVTPIFQSGTELALAFLK